MTANRRAVNSRNLILLQSVATRLSCDTMGAAERVSIAGTLRGAGTRQLRDADQKARRRIARRYGRGRARRGAVNKSDGGKLTVWGRCVATCGCDSPVDRYDVVRVASSAGRLRTADMRGYMYFDGDPEHDSARRHLERVLKGEPPQRRWPWVAVLAAGGALVLWRALNGRRSEPEDRRRPSAPEEP
jgi:hypothetical protein